MKIWIIVFAVVIIGLISFLLLGCMKLKHINSQNKKQNSSFYDLSREEMINLLQLSPNYSMTSEDYIKKTNESGCKIVKNKYRIINSRLN